MVKRQSKRHIMTSKRVQFVSYQTDLRLPRAQHKREYNEWEPASMKGAERLAERDVS